MLNRLLNIQFLQFYLNIFYDLCSVFDETDYCLEVIKNKYKQMKQVFGALRFTSAVIATISLNLSPVLAQVNSTDNSTNSQINLNSAEEKDIFDNINWYFRLVDKSHIMKRL